jgi:hypothetical protein
MLCITCLLGEQEEDPLSRYPAIPAAAPASSPALWDSVKRMCADFSSHERVDSSCQKHSATFIASICLSLRDYFKELCSRNDNSSCKSKVQGVCQEKVSLRRGRPARASHCHCTETVFLTLYCDSWQQPLALSSLIFGSSRSGRLEWLDTAGASCATVQSRAIIPLQPTHLRGATGEDPRLHKLSSNS